MDRSVRCTIDEILTLTAEDVEARRKDRAGHVLDAMYEIAIDDKAKHADRVAAGRAYMAKFLPDKKAIEHSGEVTQRHTYEEMEAARKRAVSTQPAEPVTH